jgi:membrane protease YdiL (CAAX protease family)
MSLSSLLVSLLIIWRISKGKFGDYGFTLRSRDLKLGPSLWIGVIMASLLVIPELSQMVRGSYKLSYDPTLVNVFGMMSFMWIFPGITEETLYRGLMQTYLMNELDGNVKVLRWNLHKGTIIAAIIFGLIHSFRVFSGETIGTAIITVIYAFMYGLIMGYVYQETRSLAGPIIMHNLADGGATTITYLLYLIFS